MTTNDNIWLGEKVYDNSNTIRFELLTQSQSFFKSFLNTSAKLIGFDLDKEYFSEEELLTEFELKNKHKIDTKSVFYSPFSYFSPYQKYNRNINRFINNHTNSFSSLFPNFRKKFFLLTLPSTISSSSLSSYLLCIGKNLTICKDLSGDFMKKIPLFTVLRSQFLLNHYHNTDKLSFGIYDVKYYSTKSSNEIILLILTGVTTSLSDTISSDPISLWLHAVKVPLMVFDEDNILNKNVNIQLLNQMMISKSIVNYNRDDKFHYLNPKINLMSSFIRGYIHWVNTETNSLSVFHLNLFNWIENSMKKNLNTLSVENDCFHSTIIASSIASLTSVNGIDGLIAFCPNEINQIAIINPVISSTSPSLNFTTSDNHSKICNIKNLILNMSEQSYNPLVISIKLKNILITWSYQSLLDLINDISLTIIDKKIEGKNWGNLINDSSSEKFLNIKEIFQNISNSLSEKIKIHENFLNLLIENDFSSYHSNLLSNLLNNHIKLKISYNLFYHINSFIYNNPRSSSFLNFIYNLFVIILQEENISLQDILYEGSTVFDVFFSSCSKISSRLFLFSLILNLPINNEYLKKFTGKNDISKFDNNNSIIKELNNFANDINFLNVFYFFKMFYLSIVDFLENIDSTQSIYSDIDIRNAFVYLLFKLKHLLKNSDSLPIDNSNKDIEYFFTISTSLLKFNEDQVILNNSEYINYNLQYSKQENDWNDKDQFLKSLIIEISSYFLNLSLSIRESDISTPKSTFFSFSQSSITNLTIYLVDEVFKLSYNFLIFDGLSLCLKYSNNNNYLESIQELIYSYSFIKINNNKELLDTFLTYLIDNNFNYYLLKFGDFLIEKIIANEDVNPPLKFKISNSNAIDYYIQFINKYSNISWLFYLKLKNYGESFSHLIKLVEKDNSSHQKTLLSIAKLTSNVVSPSPSIIQGINIYSNTDLSTFNQDKLNIEIKLAIDNIKQNLLEHFNFTNTKDIHSLNSNPIEFLSEKISQINDKNNNNPLKDDEIITLSNYLLILVHLFGKIGQSLINKNEIIKNLWFNLLLFDFQNIIPIYNIYKANKKDFVNSIKEIVGKNNIENKNFSSSLFFKFYLNLVNNILNKNFNFLNNDALFLNFDYLLNDFNFLSDIINKFNSDCKLLKDKNISINDFSQFIRELTTDLFAKSI